MTARLEPFDSFWQAPEDIEKGYAKFLQFYRCNYTRHLPADRNARVLVVSCGPGYFVDYLRRLGFGNVLGIDSDAAKVAHATRRNLNCRVAEAFPFLEENQEPYDLIVGEQELNHLTMAEMLECLRLCHRNLRPGGMLLVYGLNGANPITGSEALAQNIDHFNTFTEYSLTQILELSGFEQIRVMPLNLYVFYRNVLNYVGMACTAVLTAFFRFCFKLYGKSNRIFTKKIGAVCRRPG